MKKLERQLGKNVQANFCWVDFVISNTDILMALSRAPLQTKRVSEDKFTGRIFGVALTMTVVKHEKTAKKGLQHILADIQLPAHLGRTYTVVKYNYAAIDKQTTSIDLNISIDLTLLMALYAGSKVDQIDGYLNKLCLDIESSARRLESRTGEYETLLSDEQKQRVEAFRRTIRPEPTEHLPTLSGALRIAMTQDMILVTAEAKMPDRRILSASEQVSMNGNDLTSLLSGTERLAAINNSAFSVRGVRPSVVENRDFRQAAFEFGHGFYKKICSGRLTSVLPVMVKNGVSSDIRLTIDGQVEALPWETLHDGDDFLCLNVRFSRSITTLRDRQQDEEKWGNPGILIVGADSRGDLPGTETEVCSIGKILEGAGMSKVEVIAGQRANRNEVIKAMATGSFNIIHFSGHSIFNTTHPYQSSLELMDNSRIHLFELTKLGKGTDLLFMNSCHSASFGEDRVTGKHLSMCKTLREAGVQAVIGMLWSIEDQAAIQIGSMFYRKLFEQPHLGPEEAMRQTRNAVGIERAWADGSWLAPVLYT